MGVLGLTGFIDKNTHLLHRFELKDTPVVIDGNNLFHYIYRASKVQAVFGGDYDVYREKVVINFKSFLKCGITPYVVLDGGYTTDDRKRNKCLQRAKDRIHNVVIASRYGRTTLTPLLAYDTFLQALDDLNIHHVTCQFEADNEIAKLANKLKCPVISNDSDFYIFDLIHGFLPLDYIDFNPLHRRNADGSKLSHFLYCRKYQVEDFIRSFDGLQRSALPVFASLLGNDYIPASSVRKIYCQGKKELKVKNRVHVPKKLSQVLTLIYWLESCVDDSDNTLEKILPYVGPKKKFLTSVLGYYDIVNFEGSDLLEYFTVKEEHFEPKPERTFCGYNGTAFPAWFLLSICKGQITPTILNAAVLRRLIFLCQTEHIPSPSAHQCSEFVRRVVYGILLQSDPAGEADGSDGNVDDGQDCHCELLKVKILKRDYEMAVSQGIINEDVTDASTKTKEEQDFVCDTELDNDVGSVGNEPGISGTEAEGGEEEVTGESNSGNELSDSVQETGLSDEEDRVSGGEEDDHDVEEQTDVSLSSNANVLKRTQIEEYHRNLKCLKKVYLEPIVTLDGEKLPTLSDIGDLARDKRLSILLKSLNSHPSIVDGFSPDLLLFALCLCTWIKNANPAVNEIHLDCVIVCSLLLHMKTAGSRKKKQQKKKKMTPDPNAENPSRDSLDSVIDFDQMCETNRTSHKYKIISDSLDKYHSTKPEFTFGNHFDPKITHAFVQLQCLMFEASNLNKLLRFPLPNLKPARLINGTFLYNFYCELLHKPAPASFLEGILLRGSDMYSNFIKFKSVVMTSVPATCFALLASGGDGKKHKKKSKGKKKKKLVSNESEKSQEEKEHHVSSDKEESDDKEMTTIEGFEVNNKFALLSF